MDDTSLIHNSPTRLLRMLGMSDDEKLLLCRSGPKKRSHSVSLSELDDDIRNYGAAVIARDIGQGMTSAIIFTDKQSVAYECVALAFDYTAGVFSFGIFSVKERDFYEMTIWEMRQRGFHIPLSIVKLAATSS